MIFVFGSNRQGRHGAGAARHAMTFGAVYGQAEGRQGSTYAIVTKELRLTHEPVTLAEVKEGVDRFITYAQNHPELEFLVTRIGCGLAGFSDAQIAPLFGNAPRNCHLPKYWDWWLTG